MQLMKMRLHESRWGFPRGGSAIFGAHAPQERLKAMTAPVQTSFIATTERRGAERLTTVLGALLVILLGVFLLYGAGFAQPEAIHNAAHDARHAFSMPCH
jgi:cobalt transporter subunit CbtB